VPRSTSAAARRVGQNPASGPAAALTPVNVGVPVQPATHTPNQPRLFLRTPPRASLPRVEFDGNYYLPRVESMPAGAAKDY